MKFGFSERPELIDFSTAEYLASDLTYLSSIHSLSKNYNAKLYFGETSWNNKEWKGHLYPPKLPVKDFIAYYGKQFNSIELNTTHYRIPDEDLIKRWKDQMPDDFTFSPKFSQTVSHRKDFGITSGQMDLFLRSLHDFRPKLGLPFFQFPTYFKAHDFEKIEQVLEQMDPDIPIAIELRDASFYKTETLARLIDLLRWYKVTLVHTDTAGVREIVHHRITSDKLFVRFVGCGIKEIDYKRLEDWIRRISFLVPYGLQEIYFYLHEPDHYIKADLAVYLWNNIKDNPLWDSRGPKLYPAAGQTTLF